MDRNKIVETITGLGQTASQFWTNETSREFLSALEAVGLVVVPMEPNDDMTARALPVYLRFCYAAQGGADLQNNIFAALYSAMISAALGEKEGE